jgi:tellurite resistance protein
MANPFDYQFIEPLTTSADVRGSAVFCRFTCPVTGRSVSASEEITAAPPPPIAEQSQAGILGGLRRSLAAALYGMLGSTEHAEAKAEAIPDANVDADEAARRRAIARAFRSVSSLFRWESAGERWVAVDAGKDTLTAFERRLTVHPLRGTADLDLLLRMLVAVGSADGQIDAEETAFLEPFAAAAKAPLIEILSRPPATPAEAAGLAESRRESALMICWANALCDHTLSDSEVQVLSDFAAALHISPQRAMELKRDAQLYLLEKVLEEAFHGFKMRMDEEDRVVHLGRSLGLSLAQTQSAIQAFRERRGLV